MLLRFVIALFLLQVILATNAYRNTSKPILKKAYFDQSVANYMTKRICWWNEACKKQYQKVFRCRCPTWAYCRSLGRYYEAHCSVNSNGYIWLQNQNRNY